MYRGDRIARDDAVDNVYTFDSGLPDNVLIDASKREDCIARFINDSVYLYKENCRPVQFRDKDGLVQIAFYTTRIVEAGEELRYNYQCQEAPWKNQPESSADFTGFNLSNVNVDLDSIDINGSQIDNEDPDVEHMVPEAITQKIVNSLIPAMVPEAMTETIGHSSTTCAMVPEAMTETIGHSSTTGTEIDVESSAAPENRTGILATPKTPKENSVATKNYSDNSAPTESEIDVENSAAPENRTEILASPKTPKENSVATKNIVTPQPLPKQKVMLKVLLPQKIVLKFQPHQKLLKRYQPLQRKTLKNKATPKTTSQLRRNTKKNEIDVAGINLRLVYFAGERFVK